MTDVWPITIPVIAIVITLIAVYLVWKIVKERRSGFPAGDERTQKIVGKAATFALYTGMYFTLALVWINFASKQFYGSYAFEEGYALIASLLVYSISFAIYGWYFRRRADS
jgi:hypothetical protein